MQLRRNWRTVRIQFYYQLQNLFEKASRLQRDAITYRDALSSYHNGAYLRKALDSGEISLLNYLLEMTYYYDVMNKVLETEKELGLTLAELSMYHAL